MDPRNFHAWRYRRIVTAKAGTAPEQEEQYTMNLINANFSDYSAWHARTALLPQMHAASSVSAQEQGSAQQGRDQPQSGIAKCTCDKLTKT